MKPVILKISKFNTGIKLSKECAALFEGNKKLDEFFAKNIIFNRGEYNSLKKHGLIVNGKFAGKKVLISKRLPE